MFEVTDFIISWHTTIDQISEDSWDELVGDSTNPFYKRKWLLALEKSGSIAIQKGWQPIFLVVYNNKKPIAIAPLYLKGHSFGEFVFDHPFVELAGDLSLSYYPKLVGMSPFSPVEGYRFFISPDLDQRLMTSLMMKSIDDFAISNRILSCNFLYVDPSWQVIAELEGCATWINKQSIWMSEDQKNFEDYLARFNSNQRRNIKRERKSVAKKGLQIRVLKGEDINPAILSKMYKFYSNHCDRWGAWGSKYLSEAFFNELNDPILRKSLVLFNAFHQSVDEPVAMSLCVTDEQMLWGRYWGSNEEVDSLHFELCYYSPINWALKNGIKAFDPGVGGSHKQRRGFLVKPHASLHRWYNKQMDSLIRTWLPDANKLMLSQIEAVNKEMPFNSGKVSI